MDTKSCDVRCRQARSQDFVLEGANLARAQCTPYQKPKTPRIWPFFGSGPICFLFSFFYFNILFYFSAQGGGGPWPPCPPPWLRPWMSPDLIQDRRRQSIYQIKVVGQRWRSRGRGVRTPLKSEPSFSGGQREVHPGWVKGGSPWKPMSFSLDRCLASYVPIWICKSVWQRNSL